MNLPQILISQYLASLEMLKEAISKCPEKLWNNPEDKTKFWHLAYHALFYTHLYLQESDGASTGMSTNSLGSFPGRLMHRRKFVSHIPRTIYSNTCPSSRNR
jgi:hypothetical protein